MIVKTRGICLHTRKYAETSVIARVYTEELGLQSYIISGVRTRKPKVHASLLQPMSVLDMVVYHHPNRESLFRTKEIRSAHNFERIPFELQRSSVCLFAAEVLLKALQVSEAPPELFAFVIDFLLYVDHTDDPVANLPPYFLARMTEFLGFQPELPEFGGPYYFDRTQGYFLPEAPDHDLYTDVEASALLLALMQADLSEVHAIESDRVSRATVVTTLLNYLRGHMERFKGITSHRVLSEVLRA